jgi:nanoRNase/pAp phosphatase (c-di-AMP/oligoRNAs hydrolase)
VREDIGATSTLLTQYLRAADCPITDTLATALFYGIKTDTHDMSRNVSEEDLECYRTLFDLVDHRLLSRIEFPDRDAEYFRMLHRAAVNMLLIERVGYTHLGLVSTPDHIAEIADLFLSLETLEWTVVSGVFEDQVFYSVRSKETETAGIRAQQIAGELNGSGGGHSSMAAGRIPMNGTPEDRVPERFMEVIESTFGVSRHSVESLIPGRKPPEE